MWETRRAVMVQVGDETPAGPVEAVGSWHGRDFDQAVDVRTGVR